MSDMPTPERHSISRVRRETRRRALTVTAISEFDGRFRRIEFASPDLSDFESSGPDDHIKLFIAGAHEDDGSPAMRDYTPRAYSAEGTWLIVDFYLHDAGPATEWARHAKVGDELAIGGPRGSMIVRDDFDWYCLAGDETAFPAIARRIEELRPDVPITCFLLAEGPPLPDYFAERPGLDIHWLDRSSAQDQGAALLLEALSAWEYPQGDGFAFVAAEAEVTAQAKQWLLDAGHNPQWLKAAGYWVRA